MWMRSSATQRSTSAATEAIDLHSLIDEVAEAFRLAGADVIVAPVPSLIYDCRPVALKRALRNLIENAVRYGGSALVSAVTHPGTVTIAVEDDGPGLPPDQIEDAFQPFVRLEPSRSTETGGIARFGIQVNGHLSWRISSRKSGFQLAALRRDLTLPLRLFARTRPRAKRRTTAMFFAPWPVR